MALVSRKTPQVLVPAATAALMIPSFGESDLGTLFDAAFALTLVLSVILVSRTRKVPPGSVLIGCAGAALVAATGRPNLFAIAVIPLLVVVLRRLDPELLAKRFMALSWLVFTAIVSAYALFGFNREFDRVMWRSHTGDYALRASLGFGHPNGAGAVWLTVVLGTLLAVNVRHVRRVCTLLALITFIVLRATDARGYSMLALGVIGAAWIWSGSFDHAVRPRARFMMTTSPFALLAASFGLAALGDSVFWNNLLTGRPRIYSGLLQTFSVSAIFGNPAVEALTLDNGYIHHVLTRGVPVTAVYFVALCAAAFSSPAISRRSMLLFLAFLASSITETNLNSFQLLLPALVSFEIDRRKSSADFPELNSVVAQRHVHQRASLRRHTAGGSRQGRSRSGGTSFGSRTVGVL